jgi:BolA protein
MLQIRNKRLELVLNSHFKPLHLEIIDESGNHQVPIGAESHFKIIMVSHQFEGQAPIQRQKMIHQQVKNEWASGLHALSMHLYTPAQWAQLQNIPQTPACAHKR